jgi:hypothetical protein
MVLFKEVIQVLAGSDSHSLGKFAHFLHFPHRAMRGCASLLSCLFEECFEVGWCSSACRLLHLYVAEVAGQIVDSHAAHILIPLDMGEDRPPHRHFAGSMSARWLLLTRDDSFNAH